MRSIGKTKVQIFPLWTELIGQYKLYCIANLSFVSRSIRVLGGPYGFGRTSDQPIKSRVSVLLYNNAKNDHMNLGQYHCWFCQPLSKCDFRSSCSCLDRFKTKYFMLLVMLLKYVYSNFLAVIPAQKSFLPVPMVFPVAGSPFNHVPHELSVLITNVMRK